MPKEQRVIVFAVVSALLLIIYLLFRNPIDQLDDKGIVILSCLIMLSFTTLLVEHFFTRPTDVIASSVSVLLLIAPLHSSLNKTGYWYWIFFSYNLLVLVISLLSLAFFDPAKPETASSNRASAIAKTTAVRFGNGKFLWSGLLALCVFFYVDSQSSLFITLFVYAGVLLLIDPKKAIMSISSLSKKPDSEIGRLFSVQSGNAFLARALPHSTPASKLDVVGFVSSIGGGAFNRSVQRFIQYLGGCSKIQSFPRARV
jgi:hypothetical protein